LIAKDNDKDEEESNKKPTTTQLQICMGSFFGLTKEEDHYCQGRASIQSQSHELPQKMFLVRIILSETSQS
jgi:hypothetical protein